LDNNESKSWQAQKPNSCISKFSAEMKIIAFIEDHAVIDKIIDHLKLTFQAERPPPPQVIQQELLMAAEESGEYF